MEHNAKPINNYSPSSLFQNNMNEPRNILPKTCNNCEKEKLTCDSTRPCTSCVSIGKSDICTQSPTLFTVAASTTKATKNPIEKELKKTATTLSKRGYKLHVASACINCKTAHLACDVSRPCQRCVALDKTDTCQDMQHKKRGRPKIKDRKLSSSNQHSYEILYGTIQTPAIMMKSNNTPPQQQPPFKAKISNSNSSKVISFIHEHVQDFQTNHNSDYPLTENINNGNTNDAAAVETELPSVNLSLDSQYTFQSHSVMQQPILLHEPEQQPIQHEPIQLTQTVYLNDYIDFTIDNTSTADQQSPYITNNPPLIPPTSEDDQQFTIMMSMEVCCAKVPQQIIKYWGYYPQELAHRSFYDFISPEDTDRLARLHRLLLDNSMENISNSCDNSLPLPLTERTTSGLFSETDENQLMLIAAGSQSFYDTIHIKKRSGEHEPYKMTVYIGGGLGANLFNPSSFSKQYIVAQFKKQEYKVECAMSDKEENVGNHSTSAATTFSSLSPANSNGTDTNYPNNRTVTPVTTTAFTNDRRIAAATFPQRSIVPSFISSPPKFNIAAQKEHDELSELFHRFPTTTSTAMPAATTPLVITPQQASPGVRTNGTVITHPTQQYFLQTTSSTLNVAATASRLSNTGPVGPNMQGSTNRKIEMSIRSLLC